ncbi:hypothetical protein ACJIZ3_002572 [Penstemon smallii]|uniref:Uncharacterized protein n=1 Tax=Penstemon smallii TaxID=265156 RepID=A0ABD3U6S2_9LAMI
MDNSMDSILRNSEDKEENSSLMHFQDTEWTDEKHSLFLKSMETTFVNQLYKSLDLFGRHSQKNGSKSSKPKQTSVNVPSGKFKVFRDGNWSKINFMRDEPQVNQEEESTILSAKPWIQHYRSSSDKRAMRKSSNGDPSATTFNQYPVPVNNFQLWRQDSVDNNTEVTDQNFIDDEVEEGENSGRTDEMNITKTSAEIVSGYDQVVAFDNIADDAEDKS